MQNRKPRPQSSSAARLLAAGTFWGGLMFSGVMLAAVIFLSS